MTALYPNPCYNEVRYNGTALHLCDIDKIIKVGIGMHAFSQICNRVVRV